MNKPCPLCLAVKAMEKYQASKGVEIKESVIVTRCSQCNGTGFVKDRFYAGLRRKELSGLDWMQEEIKLCPMEPEVKYQRPHDIFGEEY